MLCSSMADTTILIKDPDVVRDIQRLAEQRGKLATDAVADAVRAQLAGASTRTEAEIADRQAKVAAILAEIDALPHDGIPLTDEDLYGEDGLPR